MSKPHGIIVFGANGSGKTTLGRELARILGFKHMDHEVYAFAESETPYLKERSCDEQIKLMLADIEESRGFVISAVTGDFGEEIESLYDLAVYIEAPLELRIERIKQREIDKFGGRVLEGGDLFEQRQKFLDFVVTRPLSKIEQWAKSFSCSVICVDGAEDYMKTVADIANRLYPVITHYDSIIDEINDPAQYKVIDPVDDAKPLKEYMNKWDGKPFINAMQLTPDKSVLEIGVGTGRLAVRVCEKCGNFTGIDISPKTVERAKQNLRSFPNAKVVYGDFLTYLFDQTFDVVYLSLTFMHIQDKLAAIRKIADILNFDGRFVLSIDKNQQTEIDYGTRKVPVFPDTPEETALLIIKAGLIIESQFETEFAFIFVAKKEKREPILCPNCGAITKDDILIYNESLRKQNLSISPILPVCRNCDAEVSIHHKCDGGNIIIINGTSGSGKSTVAEILADRGYLAIDGDCAIQAVRHKKGTKQYEWDELINEIVCEIDVLSLFGKNIVISHVVLPEDMDKYIDIFESHNMNYKFFLLKPEYQTAVDRCQTRTCHTSVTPEYWIKHFNDLLNFDERVVVVDNTNMSASQTADWILKMGGIA